MSLRNEMVQLHQAGTPVSQLARQFKVSRKTLYKWIKRHNTQGPEALADQSRRPHHSPNQTPPHIEHAVLELRTQHPAWGGRKLHHRLLAMGIDAPSPSTITRILHQHGLIQSPAQSEHPHRWQRFERAQPNELWQMDFKSPVPLTQQGESYPLTVIDDHSRFALGLRACDNQKSLTVREQLTRLFERYGMPWAMLSDNGPPFRTPPATGITRLELWLMRLDIDFIHGRPYHPQTQGKDERFHRTIQVEVLQDRQFRDSTSLQAAFDDWRQIYNLERPHEGIGMKTPAQRYRSSPRELPSHLPAVEYGPGDELRRVDRCGQFRFKRRKRRAGKAMAGEYVALRPTRCDGVWEVFYSRMKLGEVDLRVVGPHEFASVYRRACGRCAPCVETIDRE